MEDIVFIKAGGSGNIIKNRIIPFDYSWLFYRQMCIDDHYFKTLLKHIGNSSKKHKIGLAIGGVGAFLFINFAKQIGHKNNSLHKIGSDIINVTASILLNSFKQKKINVCPELVEVDDTIQTKFETYDLLIFKATSNHWTTDSIIADAASKIIKSRIIYFKTNINERLDNKITEWDFNSLKSLSYKKSRPPGFDPLIDLQALLLIEKHGINTVLCDKELIVKLDEIIENDITVEGLIKIGKDEL